MKRAIVTGGTRGIGLGVAKMLLGEGYFVTLTYGADAQAARACQAELTTVSANFEVVRCNQADRADIRRFTNWYAENHDSLDCLVLNAGTTLRKNLAETTDDDWERIMMVNLNSNVYLVRDLQSTFTPPHLTGNQHVSVILIGSLMGVYPHATSLAYGVTKAAVHALAKNLVKCFEGQRVTVNAIAPGFVETEWQKDKPAEIRNNICRKTALGRFATVDEVADAVRFCVMNSYVNGSIIEVSGGYSYK